MTHYTSCVCSASRGDRAATIGVMETPTQPTEPMPLTKAKRMKAVRKLAAMNLPVDTPEEMKRESVAPVEPLPE